MRISVFEMHKVARRFVSGQPGICVLAGPWRALRSFACLRVLGVLCGPLRLCVEYYFSQRAAKHASSYGVLGSVAGSQDKTQMTIGQSDGLMESAGTGISKAFVAKHQQINPGGEDRKQQDQGHQHNLRGRVAV